jgi:predicted TIM-barrel fold metal-dependent hydrolase
MSAATQIRIGGARSWTGPVIDCDVHANVPSLEALFPHMSPLWVEFTRERGWKGPVVGVTYPPEAETTARPEWKPAKGLPATDVGMLRQHILDPWQVEAAVLNCYYYVDGLRHPDWAAALASAVNDWVITNWLDKEPRLRASIVIPARDPPAAAREIDRCAAHPGFVQVMLPVRTNGLYGQRAYWPIFEAITRHDLVAGIHWGGQSEGAPSPTGYASFYAEEMVAETQVYAAQLTSMIIEGLFQKFPTLRVAMLEGGFTWLPTWAWNLNKKWKGLRREIPWVNRPPAELIREHIRFSTTPVDMGPPAHMRQILDWFNSDDLLMFASDYPHLHADDIDALLALMPEGMRANVMAETARRWYRL